ncbi:uncharacterized protein LOC103024654 [Astyanax mexicanus]|uniref:uncharacterized protein LOC103024654 n=1 Tax=Astyanax mexicanus TaxID=7994 RepID=UPI0020CB1FEB|nr:uncharacterized protein LOC103024654 [Astyanax mexicanus]
MAAYREWIESKNSRGVDFQYCEGEHVSISELKEDPRIDQHYLRKAYIPYYPKSIFQVSKVCHVTGESGLWSIFNDGGFRKPQFLDDSLLWWSLSVTKDDIADAEQNILRKMFPAGHAENQQPFLEDFTASPAFQNKSRYGNFRFTFSLKELLRLYAEQYCRESALVLRVLDTAIYSQEILYTVLVHPQHVNCYDQYPHLPSDDSGVCGYSQGKMSWRCQSPSDSFRHRMEVDREERRVHARPLQSEVYYRWDHVAVAFHVEPDWILHVDRKKLSSSVSVCEVAEINLLKEPDTPLSESDARAVLKNVRRQYRLGPV